ncbi:MAG: HypC/HybG/HupF family hydrogenase formation chaperone [Promethearchaeota archaeon]|nr:MAG: HypC/HybG/HupF family hydrogenase formation chaperone [Candidatus Lokiarchaeota archaeon]
MCLAIPGKIVKLNDDGLSAMVDFDGIEQKVIIALIKGAEVGKYIVNHAGYAIEIMDEKDAMEAIEQWKELSEELGMSIEDIL